MVARNPKAGHSGGAGMKESNPGGQERQFAADASCVAADGLSYG